MVALPMVQKAANHTNLPALDTDGWGSSKQLLPFLALLLLLVCWRPCDQRG
jgi:hypothetical protein